MLETVDMFVETVMFYDSDVSGDGVQKNSIYNVTLEMFALSLLINSVHPCYLFQKAKQSH